MERLKLNVAVREGSADLDALRAQGRVPAVLYGGTRTEAVTVSVDRSELFQVLKQATESSLVELSGAGDTVLALIAEVQRHPVSDEVLHLDFRQVDPATPVKVSLKLKFVGEAPAVKLGGQLMIGREAVRVRALPEALVSSLVIDLGQLATVDASIHVRDLVLPEGVELLDDATACVVSAHAPKKARDAAGADAAATDAAPAKEEPAKKDA